MSNRIDRIRGLLQRLLKISSLDSNKANTLRAIKKGRFAGSRELWVIDFLTSPDPEISFEAALTLAIAMKNTSTPYLLTRRCPPTYASLDVDKVHEFMHFEVDVAVQLLGAASINRNGYVREAALNGLAKLDHPDVVRFLLMRTRDYVSENLALAHGILREKLARLPISSFVQNFSLLQ